jgi:hypothetical protein
VQQAVSARIRIGVRANGRWGLPSVQPAAVRNGRSIQNELDEYSRAGRLVQAVAGEPVGAEEGEQPLEMSSSVSVDSISSIASGVSWSRVARSGVISLPMSSP